ncbi:MAG: DUF4388 domain-containing protein [Nitriliruptoraceae bacterium]
MLAGDLHEFSVAELLRLLAATSRSGSLRVTTPVHDGRIELVEGRIRQASADVARAGLARRLLGSGLVTGETLELLLAEADHLVSDLELAEMLVAGDHLGSGQVAASLREQTISAVCALQEQGGGTFRFTSGGVDGARTAAVAMAVPEVLTVVSERGAALPRLRERTGTIAAVATVVGPAVVDSDAPEGLWQLLQMVDGRRTVGELGSLWGRGEYETRAALVHLLDVGAVEVDEPEDARIGRLLAAHAYLVELEERLSGDEHAGRSPRDVATGDASSRLRPHQTTTGRVIDLTERRAASRTVGEPTMDATTVHRLIAGIEALA